MNINKFRPVVLALVVVLSALLAFGLWTRPQPKPADAQGFSAARVVKDIEVISKENHSVAHPEERARVREYLVERLEGLGADTISFFEYDSLVGPQNRHVVYTFDAVNILAEFAPLEPSDDDAYLMMVAHYDSRYSQPMPKKDTVWSYGAADDGYGLGIILETVSQVLKQREHWHQGVKILFTDAEEPGMIGMKAQWANNREIFDNVGLVINVEARGPFGPALLFEACPGNVKVMDLYEGAAKHKFTYSLTTIVYGFIPNFTDFTIIKDDVPGLNFSTITDINHYHTDKDNFSNVCEKSIQHYGEQILPVVMTYLTGEEYGDKDYFRADSDATNFTIPALGLFNFTKTQYRIVNIVFFILFLGLFGLEGVRGRLKAAKVFKNSVSTLFLAIAVLALGELVAYVSSLIAGATFKPFGIVQGIQFDNAAMLITTVAMIAVTVLIYLVQRGKAVRQVSGSMRASAAVNAASKYAYNVLYGTLALMFILSVALLLAIGENLMFFIPLVCGTVAMVLYHATSLKVWMVLAIGAVLLHAFSFFHALSMALTIGAYGAVAMLAFIDVMALIPLADLYLLAPAKKK